MQASISIIISYYKALDNLRLILKSLNTQSSRDFEVIVSEDDTNQETIDFLENDRSKYHFPIQHNYQSEDLGFRKNMMLNRAIMSAKSELLVFIDGDCIPHKHFAKEYIKLKNADHMLVGRRVMLGKKISQKVKKDMSLSHLKITSLLVSDSKKIKDGIYSPHITLTNKTRGLVGCNWGIKKSHLIAVNGYDEDYITAGVGEDNDIEWRLEKYGIQKKSMKNKAIVYHLHHEATYTEDVIFANMKIWKTKQKEGHIKCLNGIQKLNEESITENE